MKIKLTKDPQKYLKKVEVNTRNKLIKALEGLAELEGDIVKLKTEKDKYRLKIYQYRIIFTIDTENEIIIVQDINTRTNIKY